MLAHNGLALITEKLQNQRLEEASTATPSVGSSAHAHGNAQRPQLPLQHSHQHPHFHHIPTTSTASSTASVARLPQVSCGNTTKSIQQQTNLAVKGKNVWALTVESERPGGRQHYYHHHQQQQHHVLQPDGTLQQQPPDTAPSSTHNLRPQLASEATASPTTFFTNPPPPFSSSTFSSASSSTFSSFACCRHKKLRQTCYFCDSAPGTPTAPPKKKHCRSLSVPPDSSFSEIGHGRLWKPIAVTALSNSNSSSGLSDAPGGLRNRLVNPSHLHQHGHHHGHHEDTGRWLPRLPSSGLKLVPASAASSDSGHFTTSSDFQTPPGSPVPPAPLTARPASVASDATSSSSFSSMGSAWLDWSGGAGSNLTFGCRALRGGGSSSAGRTLQNRSLSCEDRISGSSSSSSSPYTAASMPCVHACASDTPHPATQCFSARCRSGSHEACTGIGSTPVDGVGAPGVSHSGVIPRCHSQPCVLHHRRCGKKRRRNCDRPTLNFNKMTETAYMRSNRRSEPWSTPVFIQQTRASGLHKSLEHCFFGSTNHNSSSNQNSSSNRLSFVLNPIASSPLDSDLPSEVVTLTSARDFELRQAASVALPLTPPDQAATLMSVAALPVGKAGGGEDGDDDEEDEEERDESNCPCNRDSRAEDGVGLMFPMVDLDLEQIENH